MAYEENNTMNQIFSGRVKVNKFEPSLVDQGYGVGVGHIGGSYASYVRQLRKNVNIDSCAVHIGKNIDLNAKVPIIINPTTEFVSGDIPKVLVELHTFINGLFVKTAWQDKNSEDIILESFYNIPSPYDKNYDWWDLYSVYFIGPENLDEGEYKVMLEAEDIKRNKLISTLEFSVKDNNSLTSDNLTSLQREKIAYVEKDR